LKPAIHLEDSILDKNTDGRNASTAYGKQTSELFDENNDISCLTRRKFT